MHENTAGMTQAMPASPAQELAAMEHSAREHLESDLRVQLEHIENEIDLHESALGALRTRRRMIVGALAQVDEDMPMPEPDEPDGEAEAPKIVGPASRLVGHRSQRSPGMPR